MQTRKIFRGWFLISSILLWTSGCSSAPAGKTTGDLMETGLSEKLFRFLLTESEAIGDNRKVCLAFGNPLEIPSRRFLGRFDDLKERLIRLDQIREKGSGKGYCEKKSGSPVVIFQIRQITQLSQNRHIMEGAWFCCGRHARKGLYEAAAENGNYRITKISSFDRCRHCVTYHKQRYFWRRVAF